MTRVCVIGNSHVACLRLGWDELAKQHPNLQLTFFAAPGNTATKLKIDGGAIEAKDDQVSRMFERTSGGLARITPGDFDVFLLCGLRLNLTAALRLASDYRPDGLPSLTGTHLVSDAFFHDALVDRYRRSAALKILRFLSQLAPQKPRFIYPQPLPSERLPQVAALRASGGERLAQIAHAAMQSAIDGSGTLLWQPSALTIDGICTPHEYSEGSRRLAGAEHGLDDNLHMNARYGEIALGSILDAISPKRGTVRRQGTWFKIA